MSYFRYKSMYEYLSLMEKEIFDELKELFNITSVDENETKLKVFLKKIYDKTKEKFIFIINEWKFMFNINLFKVEERYHLVLFLDDLLRNKPYIAFTYMAGIYYQLKKNFWFRIIKFF